MEASELTANIFRSLYFALFCFSAILVFFSIDPSMFDFSNVFGILEWLALLVQSAVWATGVVALIIVNAFLTLKSQIPILGSLPLIGDPNFGALQYGEAYGTIIDGIFSPANYFFPHSNIDISDPAVIGTVIEDFLNFAGATTILILLPIALLSGLGFLREGDTKLAIYSFLGFQLIIIVAIFTQNALISTEINTSGLIEMILSPVFTLGFLLYLLLEVAFQTSYTLNILGPMTEREKRIQEHLRRIRTFVPTSGDMEIQDEQAFQGTQSKKFGLLAASYLREMVERRVFREREVVQDPKSMMRLQSYLASLSQSDPQTDLKLAAKTAQPTGSALLRHFAPAMLFRLVSVVLLSYFIIAPEGILNLFIGFSFPALLDSLELSQPEFRTIAILNVALLIILISAVLHYATTSKRTKAMLLRVVQQIDTLVDFDRGPSPATVTEEGMEADEIVEDLPTDEEEEIS
ncbi:MAG: hypothetical protein ACFFFG_15660 [Candidatus Thorarchaeota archaeon]